MRTATTLRRSGRLLAGILCAGVFALTAQADEPAAPTPAPHFDVKNTFRNICGFCHEDYGRHTGKGPQLMDNPNSDEFLFKRIKDGKPGRMAAFGSMYSDDQIHQIVVFIRNLKPGVEPQNP
jgi:mono/diheme cytochrome c family protein